MQIRRGNMKRRYNGNDGINSTSLPVYFSRVQPAFTPDSDHIILTKHTSGQAEVSGVSAPQSIEAQNLRVITSSSSSSPRTLNTARALITTQWLFTTRSVKPLFVLSLSLTRMHARSLALPLGAL